MKQELLVKSSACKILVVDDETEMCEVLQCQLNSKNYSVAAVHRGEEALKKLKIEKFQLVITDLKMPGMGGLELLRAIKQVDPEVEVIITTGYGTVEMAVSAMKEGAYHFIQKPFVMEEILTLVEKALEKKELKAVLTVYESSQTIFSNVRLESLLPVIVSTACKILRADDASIMLMGEDGKLGVAAAYGFNDDKYKKDSLALGERVAGRVAQWKEPVLIWGSLAGDSRFSDVTASREVKSAIVYPLIVGKQMMGVLNANRTLRTEPFTNADLHMAGIFGSHISQAIFNAKLYHQLEAKNQELQKTYRQLEEAQERFVQTEKLAAIGQMAAGIAHELNNPLTGILGFSEILLEEAGLSVQQREDLEGILKQSRRCRDIINNLLHFARKHEPHKEPIEILSLLGSTLQLMQYDCSTSGIELLRELPKSAPRIFGDATQLQQVFLNILINARQAVSEKDLKKLLIRIQQESEDVAIHFEDNGCGIPRKNLDKIFDPFFTTKPVGQGTGLGLSISYGIVRQHGGKIEVESQEGVGSRFTIRLPIYVEKGG
ncbi:MAG: response regulator [Elusimicrobia bacterium]|nr:response regulator [Elusimicrobiota bacterium]